MVETNYYQEFPIDVQYLEKKEDSPEPPKEEKIEVIPKSKIVLRKQLRIFKRICGNCGAVATKEHGYCGLCLSTNIIKTTKAERIAALEYFEAQFD